MSYLSRSSGSRPGPSRPQLPGSPLEYVAQRCEEQTYLTHMRIDRVEYEVLGRIKKVERKLDTWIARGIAAAALLGSGLYSLDPKLLGKFIGLFL